MLDIDTKIKRADLSHRERKKRAQKQAIYQCALALFMERGVESTTIDMIAAEANISRATFFNYYPTKDAILHEIADGAVEHAKRVFDKELGEGSGTVVERIQRSFVRFARIVERNPHYYRTVFLDVMRSEVGFVDAANAARPNLIDVLAGHLRTAQQRGELDPALDPGQLSEMLTGIYMYTILNWCKRDFSGALTSRVADAARTFVVGCAAIPVSA
ncbi:MAG: TetR/AcrR family transcriptional regulator [Gammaproteobacteria bacterium]|nr:TetR/AcrR family transcriptional regulator [Gammaproteobacteria bacterium]